MNVLTIPPGMIWLVSTITYVIVKTKIIVSQRQQIHEQIPAPIADTDWRYFILDLEICLIKSLFRKDYQMIPEETLEQTDQSSGLFIKESSRELNLKLDKCGL